MIKINERLKELRLVLGITLEEFGKKVGITRSAVGRLEKGERNLTEQMIISVCREFDVNENWLRTGEGEMFIQRTRNQVIADFLGDLIIGDDTFKKRLIEALAELDERDWEGLEKLATKLTPSSYNNLYDSVPDTAEELEAQYQLVADHGKEVG